MTTISDRAVTEAAIDAAKAAGALARKAFLSFADGQPRRIEEKQGYFDIVTETDRQAEAAASEIIMARVPASRILGEETGWRGEGDIVWYIDPIDGTSNFASGLPFFCVSIGVFHTSGRPICAVIHDPMREETFLAAEGQLSVNGVPARCKAGGTSDSRVELLTNVPHEGSRPSADQLARFADLVENFRAVRRLGSCALQLAYVAAGRAAIGYDEKFSAWDVAAGFQLVAAGGGQLLAWDENGNRIDDPLKNLEQARRFIVAASDYDVQTSVTLRHAAAIPAL